MRMFEKRLDIFFLHESVKADVSMESKLGQNKPFNGKCNERKVVGREVRTPKKADKGLKNDRHMESDERS